MISAKRFVAGLGLSALVCAGFASSADARVMVITMKGVVSSFTDLSGAYGTPGANLAGKAGTDRYVVDTALGSFSSGSSYAGNSYNEILANFPAGLDAASSTIAGHTVNFNLNVVDFAEQTVNPPGPYNFSLLELQAEDYRFNADANGYNYRVSLIRDEPMTYSLAIPLALPTDFSLPINNAGGPIYGSGVFATYYVAYDYATHDLIQTSNIGYFDLTSVSAAGIPEPSAWTLAIVGIGLAGVALRRRRGDISIA